MRIVYLNHSGKVSGAEISLLAFFKGLKGGEEIEPILVCPTEGPLQKKAQGMDLPVVDIEPFEAGFTGNPLAILAYGVRLLRIGKKFASIVKEIKADLIDEGRRYPSGKVVQARVIRRVIVACRALIGCGEQELETELSRVLKQGQSVGGWACVV